MNIRAYYIYTIVTGILKVTLLALIVLWLLPSWQINFPLWGIILISVTFLIYEIVTFRFGKRALERKPAIWTNTMVGCCGKATTPLAPSGYVRVSGELWRASSSDKNIDEGDDIVVVGLDRLSLFVAPLQVSIVGAEATTSYLRPTTKKDTPL